MAAKAQTMARVLPKVVGVKFRTRNLVHGFETTEELTLRKFLERINVLSFTLEVVGGKEIYSLTVREFGGSDDKPGIFVLYADKPRDVSLLSFNQALEAAKMLPL